MSLRRNGLGKQVTEAKEGPLELRTEEGNGKAPRWGVGREGGEVNRHRHGILSSNLSRPFLLHERQSPH